MSFFIWYLGKVCEVHREESQAINLQGLGPQFVALRQTIWGYYMTHFSYAFERGEVEWEKED